MTEQPPDYSQPPVAVPPTTGIDSGLQMAADKIGFVPNTRKSDNAFQAKFVGASILLVALLFTLLKLPDSNMPLGACAGLGAFAGLIGGTLVSGTILAVKNLRR